MAAYDDGVAAIPTRAAAGGRNQRGRRPQTTMNDLAVAAGVSLKTVSRVINGEARRHAGDARARSRRRSKLWATTQ